MNEPIKIDIDAIEAAAKAAGGVEWSCYTPGGAATNPMRAAFLVGPRRETMDRSEGFHEADAAHIAAANPAVVLELIRRLRTAEVQSAARVEQIPSDTAMLAIFTDLRKELIDEAREFGQAIQERCGSQTLIAFFPTDASMAALNEEQMRQAGWVRAVDQLSGEPSTQSTLGDRRPPATVAREHGWKRGTLLVGDEGYGPEIIQITALGDVSMLAKAISRNGEPILSQREGTWTLEYRDWVEVQA